MSLQSKFKISGEFLTASVERLEREGAREQAEAKNPLYFILPIYYDSSYDLNKRQKANYFKF